MIDDVKDDDLNLLKEDDSFMKKLNEINKRFHSGYVSFNK
jgi:hypothetical protein